MLRRSFRLLVELMRILLKAHLFFYVIQLSLPCFDAQNACNIVLAPTQLTLTINKLPHDSPGSCNLRDLFHFTSLADMYHFIIMAKAICYNFLQFLQWCETSAVSCSNNCVINSQQTASQAFIRRPQLNNGICRSSLAR